MAKKKAATPKKKAAPVKPKPAPKKKPAAPPEILAEGRLALSPTGYARFVCTRKGPKKVAVTLTPENVTQKVRRFTVWVDAGAPLGAVKAGIGTLGWVPKVAGSEALLRFCPPWPGPDPLVLELTAEAAIEAVIVKGG